MSGNLLNDQQALLGSWSHRGRDEDVVNIQEGLENKAFRPEKISFVKNAKFADIILLCIGEEKHMSGENGTRSALKLHNEHLSDEYAKFGKIILVTEVDVLFHIGILSIKLMQFCTFGNLEQPLELHLQKFYMELKAHLVSLP